MIGSIWRRRGHRRNWPGNKSASPSPKRHYSLEFNLPIRPGLDETTTHRNFINQDIGVDGWEKIKECLEFFEPFAAITKHVEGFKYTLSCAIPLYNKLINFFEDWVSHPFHSAISKKERQLPSLNYWSTTTKPQQSIWCPPSSILHWRWIILSRMAGKKVTPLTEEEIWLAECSASVRSFISCLIWNKQQMSKLIN